MSSILIKDTTREERERIIAESIGNINGSCDGCSSGLIEMYQPYIDGLKEIREINMEFRAHYESGVDGPQKADCGYKMQRRNSNVGNGLFGSEEGRLCKQAAFGPLRRLKRDLAINILLINVVFIQEYNQDVVIC